jgi:hypothetical protein
MKTGRVGVIYVLSLYRLSFYIRSLFAYHRILSLGGGPANIQFLDPLRARPNQLYNAWDSPGYIELNYIEVSTDSLHYLIPRTRNHFVAYFKACCRRGLMRTAPGNSFLNLHSIFPTTLPGSLHLR